MEEWAAVLSEPDKGIDLVAWREVLEDLVQNPVEPVLSEPLKISVEILIGEKDKIVSCDDLKKVFKRCFTDYQIHSLLGVGHYPHLEAPQGFIQLLEK